MGSIYKRGKVYWIKYYRNGKPYRESTKSQKEADAKRLLKRREGEISNLKLPGIYFDRITFDELAEDYLTDYEFQERKSFEWAEINVNHLKKHFEGVRAVEITTTMVKAYINKRLSGEFPFVQRYRRGARKGQLRRDKNGDYIPAPVGKSTINREMASLKRMFRLGAQTTPPKVGQVPYIPTFKENNVREGFLEHENYVKLHGALPSEIQPVLTFAYHTGWRKGEILGLTWDRVDMREGTVRLEVGETKNKEARTVYLNKELKVLLRAQWAQKMRNRHLECPYVFHRNGKRIKDFRGAWKKACKAVGLEGTLFHDLRRTGFRNNVRGGIQERVAMAISGHKTRSVFDRYNIVSPDDLRQAALKQDAYLEPSWAQFRAQMAEMTLLRTPKKRRKLLK